MYVHVNMQEHYVSSIYIISSKAVSRLIEHLYYPITEIHNPKTPERNLCKQSPKKTGFFALPHYDDL